MTARCWRPRCTAVPVHRFDGGTYIVHACDRHEAVARSVTGIVPGTPYRAVVGRPALFEAAAVGGGRR